MPRLEALGLGIQRGSVNDEASVTLQVLPTIDVRGVTVDR